MAYYLQEVYCIFALSLHKILSLGRLKTNFLCTCLNESLHKILPLGRLKANFLCTCLNESSNKDNDA